MTKNIKNIAIVAHVDHGKTTLIDKILEYCNTLGERTEVEERFMDSGDIEKERGITITSKNVSVEHKGVKINIVDTPGHADFAGEVERVLCLADSVLLLVDSVEGPMPQTRFVLKKAIEAGLKPLVIVNKIDRPHQRANEVHDEVLDLFLELDTPDEYLEFPYLYASGRDGLIRTEPEGENLDFETLLDFILEHSPSCKGDKDAPGAIRVTSLEYNDYLGQLAIGRVEQGALKKNEVVSVLCQDNDEVRKATVRGLFVFSGIERVEVEEVTHGDLVAVQGINDVQIGQTYTLADPPIKLAHVPVDEPTLSMEFSVNNGPFVGKDGKFVTSTKISSRLYKELERNVSLKIVDTDDTDTWSVSGRGLLHLSILIESMRREGYELCVSRPKVIYKEIDGKKHEPYLTVLIEVPESYSGGIIELMSKNCGEMTNMQVKRDLSSLEFSIPARGMIGMRGKLLTASRGEAVINSLYADYRPATAKVPGRTTGSLISNSQADTTAYSLETVQGRGKLFVGTGLPVYEGMIIGENAKYQDLTVNVVKGKKHSNVRSSGTDKKVGLVPPILFSLEENLEFLAHDEMLEVTPNHMRLRKTILTEDGRKQASRNARA